MALQAAVEHELIERLSPENVWTTLTLSDQHELAKLRAAALFTAAEQFTAASRSADFVPVPQVPNPLSFTAQLLSTLVVVMPMPGVPLPEKRAQPHSPAFVRTQARLEQLLADDKLQVEKEEEVFDAIIRWLRAQPGGAVNDEKTTVALLQHARFPCMKYEYIQSHVQQEPLMQSAAAMKVRGGSGFQRCSRLHVHKRLPLAFVRRVYGPTAISTLSPPLSRRHAPT